MECANAVSQASWEVSGTYEFDASGMTRQDLSVTLRMRYTITEACLQTMGLSRPLTEADCPTVENLLASDASVTALCSFGESACVCDVEQTDDTPRTGTYVVDGTTLTENGTDVSSYCVEGDRLSIRTESERGTTIARLRRAD
jgi:hypothetical protein